MNQGEEGAGSIDAKGGAAKSDVAAAIMRAFEEAAGAEAQRASQEDEPDPIRMLDDAFERAQVALGSNVLPFVRKPDQA